MIAVVAICDPKERSALCRSILDDLPDWFGRPEAVGSYVAAAADLTVFACEAEGRRVGFAALSRPTRETIDIHVMGVLCQFHGRGIGRTLMAACADHARAAGAAFLTVQTVGPSAPDPFCAATRAFYRACGMAALAEFPNHWGPGTPMLLMGKTPDRTN